MLRHLVLVGALAALAFAIRTRDAVVGASSCYSCSNAYPELIQSCVAVGARARLLFLRCS